MPRRTLALPLALALVLSPFLALAPRAAAAQVTEAPPAPRPVPAATDAVSLGAARAVRARRAPVLDGRDDDAAWRDAPPIAGFRQFDPAEGADPTMRTEARVAYDDDNLYVLVRSFDPHPDSIVRRLSRRDVDETADLAGVVIDGYLDRRTGGIFVVTAAGVQRDRAIYDDGEEDESWDPVWESATRVDSLGWVAEMRIPFGQLRFTAAPSLTFGFMVWREVARTTEKMSAPLYRPSRAGIASQLGTLDGLAGIEPPRRFELLPYGVAKAQNVPNDDGWGHDGTLTAGADVKYGVTRNLTLNATFNPDFGQVEADPAVLNLSAFELRFEERRPFFQEGVGLFRCGGPCEGIFYTRRIGRTPQLRGDRSDPAATTIIGAAKLTGRLAHGISVGLVEAVTQREVGAAGTTIEPRTNYAVGRAYKELRGGQSGVGVMLTAVNRELDAATERFLRRDAYTLLAQGFHRFADGGYEVMGYAGENRVFGTAESIARTQLSSVHYYQRPDHEERYDPTRTRLRGGVRSLQLRKREGVAQFAIVTRHADPGAEMNDFGIVNLVDDFMLRNNASLRTRRPVGPFRNVEVGVELEQHWTTGGLPTGIYGGVGGEVTLRNNWELDFGAGAVDLGATHCVACARGGPALRQDPQSFVELGFNGDPRRPVIPAADVRYSRLDGGRGWSSEVSARAQVRVASRFTASLGPERERNVDDNQWVANFGAPLSDTVHYTFARLDQTTLALTARASFTLSPRLSLQLYGQPFVSAGKFSDWRELADPRASDYERRYRAYGSGAAPEGFNEKAFNSNVVARWEYRPGSTLFVVWQQGRGQDDVDIGSFAVRRDYRNLFRAHPENTVLVKWSWWFGA